VLSIAQLTEQNKELCEQLHRFSRVTAARLVATLGVLPEYHANTIRIEVLTHLAIVACSKEVEPKRNDMAKWFRVFGKDNWISRQEDPVEDVFIGPVNSSFGTFRLFTGNFADGYFIAERLITFLANGASFPTFQETLDAALALLKLSDALAERAHLKRNTPGGGHSAENIRIPTWRTLERPFNALFFSEVDLERLAISRELLSNFFFTDEDLQRLPAERLWNSSLERHPLLRIDGGVIVAEPSTLARTVARWILERINLTRMGGWADTLFQQENASLFVNDIANALGIDPLQVTLPSPPENTPVLMPFVGSFDVGKPVVLLTYAAPLAASAQEFDGFDKLSHPEQDALDAYLRSIAESLEKFPNFSGGLILVAIVTVGRGFVFGIAEWSERWRVHAAPLHDWLILAADPDCSALRLWKLAEHVARARDNYNTELLNPSGLIALWSFWKRSDFWLLPKDFDIHNPRNLLVLETDSGVDSRLEAKLTHDIHSVPSHDEATWLTVQRLNPASLFPDDSKSRIYADRIAARNQRLVGYVETESLNWWVIAPQVEAGPAHRDVLFQLWECVLQWIDRAADIIEKELPSTKRSIEIKIDLPDFARWQLMQRRVDNRPALTPTVEVRSSNLSVTLVLHELFLAEFNQPKNVAERAIVRAVVEGVRRLLNTKWTEDECESLVTKIVGNEDVRYFHVVETKMLEHLVSRSLRAQPMLIFDADLAAAQIGLAELVEGARLGTTIKGRDECREFLEKLVEKLWERIELLLRPFSREAIAVACFEAIDEINRDSEHWKITTRAVLALNEEEHDAKQVLTTRRSQRNIALIANRILIETAQYSASGAGRTRLNRADHFQLLANVELLITMANHRDAIAYGFLQPHVRINARGDLEVDQRFYEKVMRRYFSRHSDQLTERAARSYDAYFRYSMQPESAPPETEVRKFDEVFLAEFGFTMFQLARVNELWAGFAMESQRLFGVIEEPEMMKLLTENAEMTNEEAQKLVDALTLPIRQSWNTELPARCSIRDVFPWRFRRNLSLLMRPLVLVKTDPRGWVISAPFFEKSAEYITGNIHEGRLPEHFFVSKQLRSYIGGIASQHGHAFAQQMAAVFENNGYNTRTEIRLTELGAPRNPDLGDVDVLAWREDRTDVFVTECKRLAPALTVREVIQRLEDFKGDERKRDSLGKHIVRVSWLEENRVGVEKITGIQSSNISFRPLLVTSELMPMQFFEEMNFPTNQVVSADDLPAYLRPS
jgi:hypothetical protein